MKPRPAGRALEALVIVLPGSVGLFVVARSLGAYWRRDSLATLIVGTIGMALAIGLFELFARLSRTASLERELRALPVAPSESAIDTASPQLSAMLRARLEHAPLPSLGEGIAPFLTGLLVMLGLLGTLLGLFQTVRGAGHALSGSPDVEALRRSLSGPIDGLTRSFGCSAAGISASAMLGLALALVRRRESRFLRAFYVYASGPLRALSPLQRQVRALERLAGQPNPLPEAAGALEGAGQKLADLGDQLIALQQTAIKAQQRVFSDLLASMRGEFARAAGETAEALHGRMAPLLEQIASRSGDAQSGVVKEVTRTLEQDAAVRRDQTAEAMQALRERLDETESVRAARYAHELEALTAQAAQRLSQGEQRDNLLTERLQEVVQRFDAQQQAARQAESERLRVLDVQLSAARERDAEGSARLEELTQRAGAEFQRLAETLQTQLERQSAATRALEGELQQRLTQERERDERSEQDERSERALDQRSAREREHSERIEHTLQQLAAAATSLAHGAGERDERSERALEQRSAREREQSERIEYTLQQLAAAATSLAHGAGERDELAGHVREHSQRAEQALQQLAATAAAIEQAVGRQEAALARFVEQLPPLLQRAADASQQSAEQALDRLGELAQQRQLEMAGTVSAQLASSSQQLHAELARSLSTELSERLGGVSSAVSAELSQLLASTQQGLAQVSNSLSEEVAQRAEAARSFEERAQLTLERMQQSAGLLDSVIAHQSDGMQGLIGRVAELLPQLSDAAQTGALNTLSQLRENAEQYAARFSALEASLERGREQHVAELGDKLSAQASELEQRLAKTSDVVQEAAALWQASSAEMQTVAELFASSAERQREASDAWLESLGAVEGAVERAGREAARDALSDQLASTQELFARQLQFQRELFEQLRALRGGQPRVTNGERDAAL